MFAAVALLLVAQLVGSLSGRADQGGASPQPVTLSVTYGNGRIVRRVVTTRSTSAWTPVFAKTADWRSPEGLAVTALKYHYVLEGAGVRVKVAILLGQPHQKEIQVASELVDADRPVRVAALQQFGVAPVVLALGELAAPTLNQPRVENKTAALQVEAIDIATEDPPGYHLTVRNYSAKPVMTFFVEAYLDGQRTQSGRRGERDGTAAVTAGGTYRFFVSADRRPLDLIVITGLMFEDASIEGDAAGVSTSRLIYLGRHLQLAMVLPLLGRAASGPPADPAATIATLAAEVEALSVLPDARARQHGASLLPAGGRSVSVETIDGTLSSAMFEVRSGVLSDLKSAPRDRDGFTRWLAEITALYQRWDQRFIGLTAR